jgi:hypothetical protein
MERLAPVFAVGDLAAAMDFSIDLASRFVAVEVVATASLPGAAKSTSASYRMAIAGPALRTYSSTMPIAWQPSGTRRVTRGTLPRTRNGGSTKASSSTRTATSSALALRSGSVATDTQEARIGWHLLGLLLPRVRAVDLLLAGV